MMDGGETTAELLVALDGASRASFCRLAVPNTHQWQLCAITYILALMRRTFRRRIPDHAADAAEDEETQFAARELTGSENLKADPSEVQKETAMEGLNSHTLAASGRRTVFGEWQASASYPESAEPQLKAAVAWRRGAEMLRKSTCIRVSR